MRKSKQIKMEWVERISAKPADVVQKLVDMHRGHSPDFVGAIWVNAQDDPWQKGIVLFEVCERVPVDENLDFVPLRFASRDGWPRISIILSSPSELSLAAAEKSSFLRRLCRAIRQERAQVVWPKGHRAERFLDESTFRVSWT